jgi:hypothetical protein
VLNLAIHIEGGMQAGVSKNMVLRRNFDRKMDEVIWVWLKLKGRGGEEGMV